MKSLAFAGSASLLAGCTTPDGNIRNGPSRAATEMAATANPYASDVAAAVLRRRGSAADAAIAGQMMLAVVEPQASGLGGGSAVLYWNKGANKLEFYDGLASAPGSVPIDYAHGADGRAIPVNDLERSGRVIGVPGTLRTLSLLHTRHGVLPWRDLFQPAIERARAGFAMPRYLHLVLTERPELAKLPQFRRYFDERERPWPIGTIVRNPELADTLSAVAEQGADYLYGPGFGARLQHAAAQGRYPGKIQASDLAAYKVREREPLCVLAFGRRICSAAPPVAGGLSVLQQLALLDRLSIGRYAPDSPAAAHLLLEVSRLAEADRRRYAADPDFVAVPSNALLDSAYISARAALISSDMAFSKAEPGNLARVDVRASSDALTVPATTHLAIRDASGNAVSFTTTINLNFGADIVVDGVIMNDAVTNFATHSTINGTPVANVAEPFKRPITTMAPTIVFGVNGQPEVVIGAGGGARIIDSVVQTLIGYLAWGKDIRAAIEQPRIGAQNHREELEAGTTAADLAGALRAMGHRPVAATMNAAVQAVVVGAHGLEGWGDPHRDGVARGN